MLRRLAACAAVLVLAACREPSAPPPVARHVVLVTLDTLRADHVGVYGGDVATPRLDRLATEGVMARHAVAHVPLTRPSHVAMMSGRLPQETGVRDNLTPSPVPTDVPLLAEVLREAGLRTAAFVSSVVVGEGSGLDRGFERYGADFNADPGDPRFLDTAQRRGDETLAQALAWLEDEAAASERFFLWLHLYDPHDPYEPPEPWASRYPGRPYAGEVAWTDELVGRLDDALARLGLAQDTVLAVTSDHGEGLGEHGELVHGFFVYQSTLEVPLLIRGPGVAAGTRLEGVVGLVDLYPTLLDLAGVPVPGTPSGRSLAAALRGGGEPDPRPVYSETLVPRLHFGWSELQAVRDGRFKLIQAPRPELYDLETDPGETASVIDVHRPEARALKDALDAFTARGGAAKAVGSLSPETREKLAALGYVGGASTSSPGADPKDKIEDFRFANERMRRGLEELRSGKSEAAARSFGELLERGIESAEIHLHRGRALVGVGRFTDAAGHFADAVARDPSLAQAWLGMAECRAQADDLEGALQALRDGQLALPGEGALKREEGRILWLLRRPAEARAALEAAVEAGPEDASVRVLLGELLRAEGDLEGAVSRLREAVGLEPERASYWNSLGMTLGGLERFAEAEEAFRQALRHDPDDPRHVFNLGLALARQGRVAEARPFFERTLELEPAFEPAREWLRRLSTQ